MSVVVHWAGVYSSCSLVSVVVHWGWCLQQLFISVSCSGLWLVLTAAVSNVTVSDCGVGCTTAYLLVRAHRVTYLMCGGVVGKRGRVVMGILTIGAY